MKDKVSKEELYELVTNHSFSSVGAILGIGKTTVVRWCKYYELPSTKAELDNIRFINRINTISPSINVIGRYIKAREAIEVQCTVCGYEWNPTPDNLLRGHGCPRCNSNRYLSKDYPDKRRDVTNGITLCTDCHKEFHSIYGKRFNNDEQLREFLQEEKNAY